MRDLEYHLDMSVANAREATETPRRRSKVARKTGPPGYTWVRLGPPRLGERLAHTGAEIPATKRSMWAWRWTGANGTRNLTGPWAVGQKVPREAPGRKRQPSQSTLSTPFLLRSHVPPVLEHLLPSLGDFRQSLIS